MTAASARDTAWATAGFGVQFAGQVTRAVLLARLLTPDDLGRFFILRSVAAAAALIAQLGLGVVGLRRVAAAGDDQALRRRLTGQVIQASALSAVVVAAAGAGMARLAGLGAAEAWLVAAMIVTLSLSSVLADLGRGLGRVRAMAAIERIAATLSEIAGLSALFLFTGSISLRQALVVLTAAGVVPLVLLVRDVWGAVGAPFEAPEPPLMASLLSESWPLTVNGLLWRGLSELDLWLVGALAGAHAAGVYGVAMRLAAPLQVTGGIAIYVLSGPVSALHAAGRHQDLERLLRRAARWSTAVSAVGFLLIALAGPRGLALVFGPAFAGALPVFLVLGLAKLVNLAAGLGGTTLMMMGRTRTLMWISLVSSTVTLALAAVLLREFGLVGAAVAALAGVTLQNAMMIAAVRRFAGIRVYAG